MGLLTIFIIMPVAGVISSSLVGSITWILNVGGAFAGFVLGALFLPMVMFGLHQILTPIHIEMIASSGKTLLLPILAMAGAGQVGAAIALWIRCRKNKQLTNMIKGSLPVGILGIGEPLIYAVSLPLGRPFITACIGGAIGGAVIVAVDIKQKFTRLGKQVFCSQDQHELAASMAIAAQGSVYIGISNSGEKQEGLVLMTLANQLGLTTVSLIQDTENRLSELARFSLKTTKVMEPPLRSGATISLLSQLYAVSIVFYSFITKRYDDNLKSLERTLRATTELENILKDKT